MFLKTFTNFPPKCGVEDGSDTQKCTPVTLSDSVGTKKKTSTPSTSDKITHKKTTDVNLVQGKTIDDLRTSTSYFDTGWNTFASYRKKKKIHGSWEDASGHFSSHQWKGGGIDGRVNPRTGPVTG